jgi:hypothetical protein
LLWLGLGLAALGVIGFAAQFAAQRLMTPWYLPLSAMLGAVLIVASLWQRRTLWRVLALLLVVLLAGAECWFLWSVRLPDYAGPLEVGQPFPAFATVRADADGTPFTQRELKGGQNTVLVSFRGQW